MPAVGSLCGLSRKFSRPSQVFGIGPPGVVRAGVGGTLRPRSACFVSRAVPPDATSCRCAPRPWVLFGGVGLVRG